jgi:iron complex transport system ATP-binding protein
VPPSSPRLAAAHVRLGYTGVAVADDLSIAIPDGRITAIVGPNGCGKSTLLRALARLLRPQSGSVLLDGVDIARLSTRTVATQVGILPQSPVVPDGLAARDLVGRGRHPHQRWFRQWSYDDERAVDAAMAATATSELAERLVDELSGGQRQRVWIAMALAQGTDILLLDEPTTFLDLAHQVDVLELLTTLNAEQGRTVVLVLHDLNQACRYADHVIAMADGTVAAAGAPREVITEELVQRVFGLAVRVVDDPVTGTPLVLPIRPVRALAPTAKPI